LALIEVAEYSDDKTIVIKFGKGLNPDIQNMVATLGECAPEIDEPERWFNAAQKVSRNRDANEAFLENYPRKTHPLPCLTFATVRQPLVPVFPMNTTEPSPQSVPIPQPMLTKDGPAPMEVDWAQKRGGYPVVCHHCHQAGHYTWSFPQSYDVQTRTVEERLELLPKLLALVNHLDTAHPEGQPEHEVEEISELLSLENHLDTAHPEGQPEHEVEEISEPEAKTKEDFGTRSG